MTKVERAEKRWLGKSVRVPNGYGRFFRVVHLCYDGPDLSLIVRNHMGTFRYYAAGARVVNPNAERP